MTIFESKAILHIEKVFKQESRCNSFLAAFNEDDISSSSSSRSVIRALGSSVCTHSFGHLNFLHRIAIATIADDSPCA